MPKTKLIWNRGNNPQAAPGAGLVRDKPDVNLGPKAPTPGTPGNSLAYIEMIWKMEMDAAIARLHRRLEAERKKLTREYWARFWPVAVGLIVSFMAPQLKEILNQLFYPWGMGLVFPFVVLSGRPELHLGSHLAATVPQIMLYVEWPLEGLLAKSIIVGKVKPIKVIECIACIHLLAGTLLMMVSGVIR
jgi:hypothetical protein